VSLEPLWADGPVVAVHALLALAAMVAGATQLALPKGTPLHRAVGVGWTGAMAVVAASSFLIHEFRMVGPFSPIHLLSLLVLVSLWQAVRAARAGNIRRHKWIMVQLYGFALILTGAFTLLPGRTMHAVLFGGS
jgi:uncharacterized membrane protein